MAELGISEGAPAVIPNAISRPPGDRIRVGIIGNGGEGESLVRSAGFAHPDWVEDQRAAAERNPRNRGFATFMQQDDLNIDLTAVCDVFDVRAQRGLDAAANKVGPHRREVRPVQAEALPPLYRHAGEQRRGRGPHRHAGPLACPDVHRRGRGREARLRREGHDPDGGGDSPDVRCRQELGHRLPVGSPAAPDREPHQGPGGGGGRNPGAHHPGGDHHQPERPLGRVGLGHPRRGERDRPSIGSSSRGRRPTRYPFDLERFFRWRMWFDYGTGLSGDLFSHEYDAINQILDLGIPKTAVSSGGIYYFKDGRDVPDTWQAVLEYPDRDLTLVYSATLANGKWRGRVFMGHDATMEVDNGLTITAEGQSTRYEEKIDEGVIDTSRPMFTFQPGFTGLDALTSATAEYFARRGLLYTYRGGKLVNAYHLHIAEWLDVIRNGGDTSCNIERGFEEAISCHMATEVVPGETPGGMGSGRSENRMSAKTRLGIMMFLQYAIWGAWAPVLSVYLLDDLGFTGFQAGFIYALLPLATILSPFIGGQLADRYFSSEKVIGFLQLDRRRFSLSSVPGPPASTTMAWIMFLYCLLYAPTLALTNSVAMINLKDSEKEFGAIRVWGTIGWIAAGLAAVRVENGGAGE